MQLSEQTKTIQSYIQTHHDIGKLSEKEVSDFYIQLIDCIIDHNHLYYIETQSIISDKEYDELFEYLKKIEEHFPQLISGNSPTQTLVGQISEGFVSAKHTTKLMSLENTYNAQDLNDRDERVKKLLQKSSDIVGSNPLKFSDIVGSNPLKFSDILGNHLNESSDILYTIEPKFDGLSVELIYKNGVFTQAITRGDGRVGEDVTINVQTIKNIPKKLSSLIDISVRGEIVMPKSVRKEINKEREENGETPFANTRNAAAGSIKLLDSGEVAKRGLLCYVYDILQVPSPKFQVTDLEDVGFAVFPRKKTVNTIEEVIVLCENLEVKKLLDTEDVEFDGLVIKVQNSQQREQIGSTDHHPRRAVAYKFPAQLSTTQILSVDVQVGRTGILTPVANIETVQLSGAKIQRVSLHNRDFIKEKDLHINDRIWIQRSGEVIPYIVSVISDRRTGQEKNIDTPTHCPSCATPVTNRDMHYYCSNPQCKEKIKQQIQHFVSKNGLDIQGIGESVIDIVVENGIIENVADIYKISDIHVQIQLRKFPGIGEKKVFEIVKGIEESKHKALRRLLNGLGIPHVGKKIAQDLASQIQSSEFKIQNEGKMINLLTNKEFLSSIYGIGEKSVESITKFFNNQDTRKIFEQLKAYGVNIDPNAYTDTINADEAKGNFSITGSFDISREKIAEYFQKNGYMFHENPIKTTDFMLIGEKAGSKKTKAEQLGITIYEGREAISKQFPFIKNIPSQIKNKPIVQSLF